jgi:hypothetical protein
MNIDDLLVIDTNAEISCRQQPDEYRIPYKEAASAISSLEMRGLPI